MACCKCCCGGADCAEGDQGKCCCGGSSGTCCQEGEYCCDGVCEPDPCECVDDEDCTAPPGEVAQCCDGVCKDTLNDTGACTRNDSTCYETDATTCGQEDQSNLFDLCGVCPP